jgi:hypothetical protein
VRRLREAIGTDRYNGFGQLADWRSALVPGIEPRLLDGSTFELRGRLVRPESVASLTLNSFVPWLPQAETMPLAGLAGFRELHFDARCPTGVRGTPPHIELMASGPQGVAGATVHAFDYLSGRQSKLSPAYDALAVPPALAPWATLMRPRAEQGMHFRYVDVPALTKLAVGLGRIFFGRPVRLLYLFLEPLGAAGMTPFQEHRAELAWLAECTADSAVKLVPCSFHELWAQWQAEGNPPGVREIVAELSRRYAVAMPR